MLLLLLVGGSAAIAYFAIEAKDGMNTRAASYAQKKADKSAISQGSGSDSDTGGSTTTKDIVSDDGVVGNPKKYANSSTLGMLCVCFRSYSSLGLLIWCCCLFSM